MPLDFVAKETLPVDAVAFHGVERHLLVRHAMERIPAGLRRALIAVELEDGGTFVNMGMNFQRVAWRAVWRLPGLPEAAGIIPIHRGEIVS